jgi:hypothetical protein
LDFAECIWGNEAKVYANGMGKENTKKIVELAIII